MRVRGEVSKKNKYWIDKDRYYELKHFCLQYPIWKRAYLALDGYSKALTEDPVDGGEHGDPTRRAAEARYSFYKRMSMIEEAARETDVSLRNFILKGVTEGLSYDVLKARYDIPCCKDVYYDLYRKFFWLLSQKRQ